MKKKNLIGASFLVFMLGKVHRQGLYPTNIT
jgi:hypothetical protein